jgi:DNA-binding CsgD family transcriptional regulator
MERLGQSDLQSLLAFVRECYAIPESASFESFLSRVLALLPRLIPAAIVTYNEMIPERSESRNWSSTAEFATPKMDRLWAHHMHEHPVLVHILETGVCSALRISDFWNQLELHDRGLYHDFYRLSGIEDVLCIQIPCPRPGVIGIAWHDDRSFTDHERLIADLVRPHIGQAWRNVRLVSRLLGQFQMLQLGVENLGVGVILCGPNGRVQFINAQARRYLAELFSTTRQTDHCLPPDLLLWMRHENSKLIENGDAPSVRTPLVIEKENKRLVVSLLSQSSANLILMEEQPAAANNGVWDSFGLTSREAEVLRWIAMGKTNNEIATILGMQTGTAKKHVEHIFEKLGVETRTSAASLVLATSPHKTVH